MNSKLLLNSTKLVLLLFWLGVFAYVLTGAGSANPFQKPPPGQQEILTVMPEGWAFFTRNAREPVVSLYREAEGRWAKIERSNFQAANWFGMKREPDLQMIELKYLRSLLEEDDWIECDIKVPECLQEKKVEMVSIRNESRTQKLCGDWLLSEHERVPWAWAGAKSKITPPSKMVPLSISCP